LINITKLRIMNNKEKLLEIASKEKTKTIKRNKLRIKFRWFIRVANRLKLWWLNVTYDTKTF